MTLFGGRAMSRSFFFFQAEDGIRDLYVTGVQTCALPISLSEALPPGYVTVERERSMSDRMRGRPGEVSKVAVRLGDQLMTLEVKNGQPAAEICREVRGVVLSRQNVPLQQWASALASALVQHAETNAQAAQALRRLVTGA